MNWTKFAYHSFLTVVLGVTLSVCSNVMETDDFEIEAIANSSTVKYGSKVLTSKFSQTISFDSSFSSIPVLNGLTVDYSAANTTCDNGTSLSQSAMIFSLYTNSIGQYSNLSKNGFDFDPLDNYIVNDCGVVANLYYSVSGN